ncbi:hypothetical protein QJS66_05035 [Kocuria rhizophila]|nr:hypothetical protein QJS66_05035 [Kocuria rhizophila]
MRSVQPAPVSGTGHGARQRGGARGVPARHLGHRLVLRPAPPEPGSGPGLYDGEAFRPAIAARDSWRSWAHWPSCRCRPPGTIVHGPMRSDAVSTPSAEGASAAGGAGCGAAVSALRHGSAGAPAAPALPYDAAATRPFVPWGTVGGMTVAPESHQTVTVPTAADLLTLIPHQLGRRPYDGTVLFLP